MLKYYNILENNYFKIIEQKNSIFYLIKKYKKNNNQLMKYHPIIFNCSKTGF